MSLEHLLLLRNPSQDFFLDSSGQKLALTVLCVPYSLDSVAGGREEGPQGYLAHEKQHAPGTTAPESAGPFSSEDGRYTRVKARLWPRISGNTVLETFSVVPSSPGSGRGEGLQGYLAHQT